MDTERKLLEHDQTLRSLDKRVGGIEEKVGLMALERTGIASMFEHITDATNILGSKFDKFSERVDQKFTEQSKAFSDICALRHKDVDRRIDKLEEHGDVTDDRIADMGENTKITYIKKLQEELHDSRVTQIESKKLKHEWQKWVAGALFGIVMAALSAFITYKLNVATFKATQPLPTQAIGTR
jgi:hypothetical protein